jgi:hypothetical protein
MAARTNVFSEHPVNAVATWAGAQPHPIGGKVVDVLILDLIPVW